MRTVISLLKRKRIWIFNFILPFLFGFFLLNALGKNISKTINALGSTIKVGIVNEAGENELLNQIEKRKDIQFVEGITKANIEQKIKEKEITVGLIIPSNFNDQITNDKNAALQLFHQGYNNEVEDFVTSITEFENDIISNRLDSLNVSSNYINPITIKEKNVSNLIATIDNNFRNFIPVLLFIFAFLGLIFPCSSTLYNVIKKDTLKNTPLWDRLLGVSFLSVITVLILIASFWCSISFTEGHPAFLKGIIKNYLSIGNVIKISSVLFLSNILWSCLIAFLDRKTERRLGRFGIYFFIVTFFITSVVLMGTFISLTDVHSSILIAFVPLLNGLVGSKEILTGNGMSFSFLFFLFLGLIFWANIGFFILKFSNSNKS